MTQSFNMTAPADAYRTRRATLAASIDRPMMLFAGEPRARQYPTNTAPFRAGSNYLYFGGPPVAGAALIIMPKSDGAEGCFLVRRVMDFEDAVWIGESPADSALSEASGIDQTCFVAPDEVEKRLSGRKSSFLALPCPTTMKWIQSLGLDAATPDEIQPIIDLRLIKDEHELVAMRFAAKVGVEAHLAGMRATKPGRHEAHIAAAFHSPLIANRCNTSFSVIVTVHGEVLHPDGYQHVLEAGQLLLLDGGAEEPGGYASDITRTYPVSGSFTPIQRQLYDTVLRAERAAIAECVPGRRFRDVHDTAARIICEGLVEAGLLRGDPGELFSRAAHTLFFCHGLGHLIGLDVHDMEDFGDQSGYAPGRSRRTEFGNKFLRLDRDLESGLAVTIEPGFYVVPAIWQNEALTRPFADVINRKAVDELLAENFGGIRIEETIIVRDASGPEVLSADLPSDADAVTAIIGQP